jgi:hypothetical protein
MASAVLGALATDLANAAVLRAGGRLREAAFGPAQQRKLKELLGESIRVMLDELTRSGELADDADYVADLRIRLTNFFSVEEVAGALVAVAVDYEPLPLERLREIYEGRDYDAGAFPVTFEWAMNACTLHLTRRVREEASTEGSPLNNLVEVSKLYGLEESMQEVLRRTEPTGPTADELERESLARCKRRWTILGVPVDEAEALAKNPMVGAPGPNVRAQLGQPVTVIAAEAGSGKSLLLDRLMQRAIASYREREGAPLPVFIDARRVEGRLREAVVERTRSLGRPGERGAAIFLDGLEEAGRSEVRRLLDEAHYLPDMWPNTTVVVAGRPLQELEEEKERGDAVALRELSDWETEAIIRRISGDDVVLDALVYGLPESVHEAIKRPLFATLVGLDMRDRFGRDPRSIGELLSHLVERTIRNADEAVELKELRDLAVAVTNSVSGRVRTADVGTRAEVRHMRATGLVQEEDGTLRFSLQILSEWFAAQALELGDVHAEDLASDFARLERWRYPLVMAVSNFGYERVLRIFEPIVRAAPAFASQVVDAAFARSGGGAEGAVEGVEEVITRFRRTMGAWVEGLGPLAPFFAPVRGDGSLGTLAITGWGPWEPGKGNYAWYAGQVNLPDVVPFSRIAKSELAYGIPQRTYVVGRQAAWPWHTTFRDLRGDLEKALKANKLPTLTPMLAKEAVWRTAKDILFRERRKPRSENRAVPLDELEELLDEFGAWDGEWIWRPPPRTSFRPALFGVRHLVEEVRRLRDEGETEIPPPVLPPPVPGFDLTIEEARERAGNDGTVYTWDLYSDERLLERARLVVEETLRAYAKTVETLLSKLAPHMPRAATLPCKLVGRLDPRRDDGRREPNVRWYLEPLPFGCESTSELSLGTSPDYWDEYDEYASYLRPKIASLRPQSAGWLAPQTGQLTSGQLFDLTPVTKTVHYWLWRDLWYAKWVASRLNPWSL